MPIPPMVCHMIYRPELDRTSVRAAFRHWKVAGRRLVKTHFSSLIFSVVFFVDRLTILLAKIFPSQTSTRCVAFVRTDNLGDFVLWLPAAKAIRAGWPWSDCRYVLIANDNWSQFAEDIALFDSVLPLNRVRFQRNLFYRIAMIFRLARVKAELVVTPIHSRDPSTANFVARAIDSKRKIASSGDLDNAIVDPSIPNGWYNELIACGDQSAHNSLRNKEFTERLMGFEISEPWPQLAIPSLERLPDVIKDQEYVVFAPGASSPQRTWPADFFSGLANKLSAEMSLGIVVIGTASEASETAAVARRCSRLLFDFTAQSDITSLLAILGHAKLVVTNETGTAQLAAALRVPTVCIVGGGHFGRFLPYPDEARDVGIRVVALHHPMPCFSCNWKCIYPIRYFDPAPCVSGVSVDAAWSAVQGLMS